MRSGIVFLASTGCVLLAGCYSSSTLGHGASGARIRRVVLRPEDGEPTFGGWYDSELEVGCGFTRAEDGRTRCLPVSSHAHEYEDSDCASPVLEAADEGCEDARFAYQFGTPDGCGEMPVSVRQFEVDPAVIAVDRVYVLREGECVATDRSLPRAHRLMRMDPTRFVAGEWTRGEDTGGPILTGRFTAEDGATTVGRMWDRDRGAWCERPYAGATSPQPCLPARTARTRPGGASCDEVWALGDEGCAPPELAYSESVDECLRPTDVHVFGIEGALADADRVLGETCGGPIGGALYCTRPADDEVPWITLSWRGSGRLQPEVWADDEGHDVARMPWTYYDAVLGSRCVVRLTTDGLRCVPGTDTFLPLPYGYIRTHFADDACSVPAAAPHGTCLPPPFVVSLAPSPDTCLSSYLIDRVYRVGAPIERAYHREASGACVIDDDVGEDVAHAVTPIPLDQLVRVERTIE